LNDWRPLIPDIMKGGKRPINRHNLSMCYASPLKLSSIG
jgi:hypothetical protein